MHGLWPGFVSRSRRTCAYTENNFQFRLKVENRCLDILWRQEAHTMPRDDWLVGGDRRKAEEKVNGQTAARSPVRQNA